ncbi:SDR family oxidoreductase [Parvularcula maris]|uniref:SDR family oxidoreductase n=1 Tax=Parvularcula maris TaxID=2965077 RepID=A0A9X2L716_9PROT|nr:SDR family oxidoreductase [Parvularcula maris]MCQ8184212.1 SDR family oxidoreductase [Parvularcula maris]
MLGTIIVTGAAGVLGRAVCAKVEEAGGRALGVDLAPEVPSGVGGVDLTDEAAVTEAFGKLAASGPIQGLANIAGGFVWEKVEGGSAESFDRLYRMNLRTAVLASRAVLPHLSQGGAIVNVGAAAAAAPGEGMAPYAASKAGVSALTESLAEELRVRRIRVNAVLPTILDTPTNRGDMPDADFAAWVDPEDAAEAVVFLLSEQARAVTGASLKLSLGRG